MTAEIYWIPGPWPGRFGILPRPRGGDWLGDDVRSWRAAGLDDVVSLLTPEEVADLDLGELRAWSRREGIEFLPFPIADRGVPESRDAVSELVANVGQGLASSRTVAVHCRQGVGRSGLVAALVLMAAGAGPDAAFRTVAAARGTGVPETAEQRRWADDFAAKASLRRAGHG
jgi:rhodanese/phosphatase family protein